MIFLEPELEDDDRSVLALLEEQRSRLDEMTSTNPRRWLGSLRRNTFARAIQGSNTIEGYNATLDEAVAAVEDEPPLDERTETWFALSGYRAAMTYVLQSADDPTFEFTKQYLKSLHFMMVGFDMTARPGRYRSGGVFVVNQKSGDSVYNAPSFELVDPLIDELVAYVRSGPVESAVVTAAMAHLNLTMIHPFKDGNGRMARALQTLVLARDGHSSPISSSIEEWLGQNTQSYYAILARVGQGRWNPTRDAGPWVKFCLTAHYQQAATSIRRADEYSLLYDLIETFVKERKLNERVLLPVFDAALGLRLTNSRYQREAGVTGHTATKDLKLLSDQGILEAHGAKRGRHYLRSEMLLTLRQRARQRRTIPDPYDIVAGLVPEHQTPNEPRLPGF